jgi:protein SCO1/2
MRKALLALLASALALTAWAQNGETLSDKLYFKQKLGTTIPLDLPFKDESGKDVRIGDYFKDKPVILVLVFFDCKSSCLLIKEGLLKTLNAQKQLKAGQDFDVVIVSINHKETYETAEAMKAIYMANYKHEGTDAGWHLLTGKQENIRALTESVGFGFSYEEVTDPQTKEVSERISHPSGIIVLTPHGTTSLYLLGATYPQELLRRGIEDARNEKVGQETETILLGCFMYDPKTGKYRPMVERMLMIGGIATALILFTSIGVMSFKHRRSPIYPDGKKQPNPKPGGPTSAS